MIAPREAEALMHEIETIDARRDELDDRELEHLEEQSTDRGRARRAHAGESRRCGPPRPAADGDSPAATRRDRRRARPTRRANAVAEAGPDRPGGARPLRRAARPARRGRHRPAASAVRCDGCHLDLSAGRARRACAGTTAGRAGRVPAMRSLVSCAGLIAPTATRPRCCCWFLGTAVVTVWLVFRDPRFDYRLLLVGARAARARRAVRRGARCCTRSLFSVVAADAA